MDITSWDMTVLVASTIGIVIMSFLFPAAGLGGDQVNESDVPEFTMDSNRFDLAGDFPQRPGAPSEAYVEWREEIGTASDNTRWLAGNTDLGYQVGLLHNNSADEPQLSISIFNGSGSQVDEYSERHRFNETYEEGDLIAHYDRVIDIPEGTFDWEVAYFVESVDTFETPGVQNGSNSEVRIEVRHRPEDESWLDNVPIVGGLFSAADAVAGAVLWIGAVVLWSIQTVFSLILNLIGMTFDVIVFGFGLASWLVTTYSSIVSGAPSAWAGVILTIPGVLFGLIWAKIAVVAINVIWIG